jgi:hypothetical protein
MADETTDTTTPKQPSWAWVLLLGLPGAVLADQLARHRGASLARRTWAAAWAISGAGIIAAMVLSMAHASTPRYVPTSSAAGVATPDYGTVDTPFVSTPTPAPPTTSLSSTDTASWQDDQGYSYQATMALGRITAYQPGLSVTGPRSGRSLTAGSACQLTPAVDAVLPVEITVTNTTSTYAADVSSSLEYFNGPDWQRGDSWVPTSEAAFSEGPECNTEASLDTVASMTCHQLQPEQSCSALLFVIFHNFYGPQHPSGDVPSLDQHGLTLGVSLLHTGGFPSFPTSMTGSDVLCDDQGHCAIPLKGLANTATR